MILPVIKDAMINVLLEGIDPKMSGRARAFLSHLCNSDWETMKLTLPMARLLMGQYPDWPVWMRPADIIDFAKERVKIVQMLRPLVKDKFDPEMEYCVGMSTEFQNQFRPKTLMESL